MERNPVEERALAAARSVAMDCGLACQQAAIVRSGSNVLIHLRPAPVVARVMTGTVALHDDPQRWLEREVAVLRYLAPSGVAVAPSALIEPGPFRRDDLWMTFSQWLAHEPQSTLPHDAEGLGRALRDLHAELSGFAGELGSFLDVRADIERLLGTLQPTPAVSTQRIELLRGRLQALGETVFATALPTQALHGDASLSNLLRTAGGLVWNDFEDTFRGPVHWDLAGYMMSLRTRGADTAFVRSALDGYGWADERELAPFVPAHDLYGEIWGLYDVQRRAQRP
jgi:Ser/Thr protein kinase RdoA (MazF antagonist)